MDTGRHRAMVVVDPKDRRNLKGFLYMSGVYSPSIDRAEYEQAKGSRARAYYDDQTPRLMVERRMLQGLADRMVTNTQVHVEVRDAVRLDDPQLLQVPFVLMTFATPFEFTDSEAANLGAYLTGGGFLFVDIVRFLWLPITATTNWIFPRCVPSFALASRQWAIKNGRTGSLPAWR